MFWLSPHEGLAWEPLADSMGRTCARGQGIEEANADRKLWMRRPPGRGPEVQ